jgi:hypothetical protein
MIYPKTADVTFHHADDAVKVCLKNMDISDNILMIYVGISLCV